MEVGGRQPGDPLKGLRPPEKTRLEAQRTQRERGEAAEAAQGAAAASEANGSAVAAGQADASRSEPRDQVDLSSAARSSSPEASDPAREERLARLRQLLQSGELFTPERLARAAESLLSPL